MFLERLNPVTTRIGSRRESIIKSLDSTVVNVLSVKMKPGSSSLATRLPALIIILRE